MAESRSLLAMSYADPNRVSTTFTPGEIWSLAKDGATGLDSKAKKKLWTRLKKEVIYRDSPEDLEEKKRMDERKAALEYRSTQEYHERVAVDLAAVKLKLEDEAAELGLEPGRLLVVPEQRGTHASDDEEDDDEIPTRRDLLMARVLTEQRVMAQLRSGNQYTEESPGLSVDVQALAKEAALAKRQTMPDEDNDDNRRKRKDHDDDREEDDEEDERSRSRRRHHHRKHRRRRRDDY